MQKTSIRTITAVGMLTALSIVLTRLLVPLSTDTLRFSFGNIPVILAGVICGPLAGGVCGALSDVIGCFFGGYAPNPLLSLSAITVGFLPAVLFRLSEKLTGHGRQNILVIALSMIITNLLTSVLWSTFCLHLMFGTPYKALFALRIPVNSLRTFMEIAVLYVLFKSHFIERIENFKK